MPQNSQASNINWNEQPQERPNLAMAASAPGSCRMENGVQRCSLAPPQDSLSPRECHSGHLHVMTGYGYNGFHQNQRYDVLVIYHELRMNFEN